MRFAVSKGETNVAELTTRLFDIKGQGAAATAKRTEAALLAAISETNRREQKLLKTKRLVAENLSSAGRAEIKALSYYLSAVLWPGSPMLPFYLESRFINSGASKFSIGIFCCADPAFSRATYLLSDAN